MILVGITGSIGSGKTTFAQFLAEQTDRHAHFESWEVVAQVANELRTQKIPHPKADDVAAINAWLQCLPAIIEKICHKTADFHQIELSEAQLHQAPDNYTKLLEYLELMSAKPELQIGKITEASKETYRSILQWLGGYLVKTVGAGIWYDEIVRRIQSREDIDLATVGGVRFPGDARRIVSAKGSVICINRPSIAIKDATEITERERALIVPDATIINDAGLPELLSCAARVWKDLGAQQLLTEYTASEVQA